MEGNRQVLWGKITHTGGSEYVFFLLEVRYTSFLDLSIDIKQSQHTANIFCFCNASF